MEGAFPSCRGCSCLWFLATQSMLGPRGEVADLYSLLLHAWLQPLVLGTCGCCVFGFEGGHARNMWRRRNCVAHTKPVHFCCVQSSAWGDGVRCTDQVRAGQCPFNIYSTEYTMSYNFRSNFCVHRRQGDGRLCYTQSIRVPAAAAVLCHMHVPYGTVQLCPTVGWMAAHAEPYQWLWLW
jgi:hypothetical protein